MLSLALRRLAASLLLVYLVLTLTFFLIHLAPGDPANLLVGERTSPGTLERLRTAYGLDRPLPVQYLSWLRAVVLRFEWGTSLTFGRPAIQVLGDFFAPTALLAVAAMAVNYAVGVPLGVAAARRRGTITDGAVRVTSLILYSTPLFWMGLMAILLFSHTVPVFPAAHMRSVSFHEMGTAAQIADVLRHLALPAITLGLALSGATVRFVRNKMVEVLEEDYVRTARAKGLSERRVIWVHALRNVLVPVIQLFGLALPALLNGTLILEVVFSWPGLGRATYQAILARDYPVILASTAFTAVCVVAGNLLADLLHAAADPRIRGGLRREIRSPPTGVHRA